MKGVFSKLILLLAVLGGLGYFLLHELFPTFYFESYVVIPLFFLLVGGGELYFYQKRASQEPDKKLLHYLVAKLLKLIFSLLFIVTACFIQREVVLPFLLTFSGYYLVFLVYETWVMHKI